MTALPPGFRDRYGPWAVVTGASSGIGEELTRQLARAGLQVVAVARRLARLDALAEDLRERLGAEVRPVEADLATERGRQRLFDATADLDVGLFAGNAGFGLKGDFTELSLERMLAMIALNCTSTLALTHHFARRLRAAARPRAGIVITSSTAAFQGIPYSAAYAATKGFGLQLAEALHHELAPHRVDVLALCPGPVDTEGPRRTGVDPSTVPVRMMDAAPVVTATLRALGRRAVVVPGAANRLGTVLARLVPRRFAAGTAGRIMRRVVEGARAAAPSDVGGEGGNGNGGGAGAGRGA